MANTSCPECKYEGAEKTISYKKEGWRGPYHKVTTWACPKCNFQTEKQVEISVHQYRDETGITKTRNAAIAARNSCRF